MSREHEALRVARKSMGEAAQRFIELRRALGRPEGQARSALDGMAAAIQRATSALGMGVALTEPGPEAEDWGDVDERAERYSSALEG